MRIPRSQPWLLRRLGHQLCRSDPHLAAMLAVFARLYAAEAITSTEQTRPHLAPWLRTAVAGIAAAMAGVAAVMAGIAAVLAACGRWASRRVASVCAAMRRRPSRSRTVTADRRR